MIQLTNVEIQSKIVDFVVKNGITTTHEIGAYIGSVPRPTLSRYLRELRDAGILVTVGKGRSSKYALSGQGIKAYPFDLGVYDAPYQSSKPIYFNHALFEKTAVIFTDPELVAVEETNTLYRLWNECTEQAYKDSALERCAIEFSWKSSKIEGNTYTLLETEHLIKNKEEAQGKRHDDAVMILNQKQVFDLMYREHHFQTLTTATLIDIHTLLVKDLPIKTGLRKSHVGITGTEYLPLTIQSQLEEALTMLLSLIAKFENPFEKAVVALAGVAYIQPFVDGNKRASRHFANLILHVHGLAPVAWRTVDELMYKKAMIAFYELGNIRPLAELWVRHYHETVHTFFKTP